MQDEGLNSFVFKAVKCPPDRRSFNENDVLGHLNRDDKGNVRILQNKEGLFIDKHGSLINQKGYLLDPQTLEIVDTHQRNPQFQPSQLD